MKLIPYLLLAALLSCSHTHRSRGELPSKSSIQQVRPFADRSQGLVQLTGKDLVPGQIKFPKRTPADAVLFEDQSSGEIHLYGTQVDGTGFSFLRYKNRNELLRGAEPELISKDVFLPNGQKMEGKEAIWDTFRLPYWVLLETFPAKVVQDFYRQYNIEPGSDIYYGGIALKADGSLGRWADDNWRRRVHAIAHINGRFQIIGTPVFNPIKASPPAKSQGFGSLSFLPGDYIGHAYGPNFKLVPNNGNSELWIISEEITRRVRASQTGKDVEVTEIMARKMDSPLKAQPKPVELISVNDEVTGKPHPDSDRGKEMSHAYLIEGFRPTSTTPEGIRLNGQEYFFMTGSPGNFAGDDYDVILAVREGSAIGPYQIIKSDNSNSWKRYLAEIKKHYHLSWAGRGSFLKDDQGEWWLIFHAVDKELKPEGSYSGVIPPNTEEYHRNLYAVPIEFYLNSSGQADMKLLP